MLAIRMEILGTVELDFAIGKLLQATSDWSPIWPKVREVFRSTEESQFQSRGAKGRSGKWAALKPSYARWKQRHFPGKPLLERTGRLVSSLAGFGTADSIYVATTTKLTIGTRVPYAWWMQQGAKYMQPRKVVDITQRQQLDFAKVFQIYVNKDALKGFSAGGQRRIPFGVRV